VKFSLAEKGISDRYPVVVDCDHGTVQLSGVVASPDDAKQAQMLAQNVQGVVAVKNQLTWR
jgi:osmotically-inducible protein OsmY